MAGKSDYLESKVLEHTYVAGQTFVKPAKVYVGVFTTDPGEGAGGTEVVGAGYARVEITNAMAIDSPGVLKNTTDVLLPVATGPWAAGEEIKFFATFDAPAGGNRLHYGGLTTPQTITTDQQLKIPVGQLVITED